MNCRSVESLFSSYVEDEISQEERRDVEAHLMGCRRCSVALSDVRATMSILEEMPLVEPSAHFDEDVYAKIRSGEGLRPTALELIRELLSPFRLKPVYMAGAGASAVAVALLLSPVGQGFLRPARTPMSASRVQGTAAGVIPAPAASVAQTVARETAAAPSRGAPSSRSTGSVVASMTQTTPAARDTVDGRAPRQRYTDEIINDQFYLDHGPQGQDPSVVPVNETQDDGVYIVF
jgi:anti-sigma factor RsiW